MTKKMLSLMMSAMLHGAILLFVLYTISMPSTKNRAEKIQVSLHLVRPSVKVCAGKDFVSSKAVKPMKASKRHASSKAVAQNTGYAMAHDGDENNNGAPSIKSGQGPRLLAGISVRVPYPKKARQFRVEGSVKMLLSISKRGQVESVEILSGPGFGLKTAAERLAKMLTFAPAIDERGEAMVSKIEHEVIFRLTDAVVQNS